MWNLQLRSGLASFVLATTAAGAMLAACGDDGGAATDTPDAASSNPTTTDGGADVRDAARARNTARLTVVNATHDLGPSSGIEGNAAVRICFKQGSIAQNLSVAPFPPLPDRPPAGNPSRPPGIYYGSGATLPAIGLDFGARIVVPVVLNAKSLSIRNLDNLGPAQRPLTCDELVGDTADAAGGLVQNTDYWVLPQIEAGTLADGKAYVLALTGCAGEATTPNPGKCGPGFVSGGGPSSGNLKLTIYETTQSPIAAPFGAQLLYVSTQANAFYSQATAKNSIQPGFVSNAADGGGFRPITDFSPPFGRLSEVVPVEDVEDSDAFVFGPRSLIPSEALLGAPLLPSSLVAIHGYSGLGAKGEAAYPSGHNYVFIAVGDPDTNETKQFVKQDGSPGGDGGAGSRFNTRFFHFLAFPTDPTIEPYSPP